MATKQSSARAARKQKSAISPIMPRFLFGALGAHWIASLRSQ
jgi:hypothetical protein